MSATLRLEVHRITLETKVRGERGKRDHYDQCNFDVLLSEFDKDKAIALAKFWTKFVEYFQGEFLTNTSLDKAITITNKELHTVASERNTINGEVSGGPTNREQIIFKRKDAQSKVGNVADDDVVSSRFYIKLWLPCDYTSGILMIQSYSNSNVSDLIKDHLKKFIQNKQYRVQISSYFPKSLEEKRSKHSEIVSVTYVKDKISKDKRKLLNPMFAEFEDLSVKIVVSGFKKPVKDFWKNFKKDGRALSTDIDALDIKQDEDINVLAKYKDANGRSSTFKFDEERLRDFSYIYLPEEIKIEGKNMYDFNKLSEHTDSILESIKEDIGYIKNKK